MSKGCNVVENSVCHFYSSRHTIPLDQVGECPIHRIGLYLAKGHVDAQQDNCHWSRFCW